MMVAIPTRMANEKNFEGLVILYHTAAAVNNAAKLHAEKCPMVNTGRKGRGVVRLIATDVAGAVEDFEGRGFPVKRCKCCK